MQIAITALDSPRDVLSWKAHDDEINQIRFSRDRRLLASCSDDGSAKVWRIIQSTTDDRVLDAASKMQLVTVLSGHNSRVTRLEWSPALPEDSLYIITLVEFAGTCGLLLTMISRFQMRDRFVRSRVGCHVWAMFATRRRAPNWLLRRSFQSKRQVVCDGRWRW